MSIGICRVEKYKTAHDIVGIQIHDRRERDHSNSNPDIDFTKSRNNYSLCENASGRSFNEYIDEQIKTRYTGKKAIRKDAVRMFQVLFTSDKDFFNRSGDNGREYFESCLHWACERWGTQNIVSAVVHLDEDVPHMHVNIIPLTGDGRLSAKDCVGDGSKALQQLQDDFFQECSENFNLERGSRTKLSEGEKPRKHQRMGEYKRNIATIQAQEATIRGQVEILHAEPENAIQGVPVPSMAKPFIGKENKGKILYNPDDVAAIQQLSKATAVTAANTDRRQAELDELSKKIAEKEKETARVLAKAQSNEKAAEEELSIAKQKARGIIGNAEFEAQRILKEAENKAQNLEKSVEERENACRQREQRNLKWETELRDKADILELRETEPDVYYKAIIAEKDDRISDLALSELRLSSQCETRDDKILELENRVKMLEESNDDYEKRAFSLSSDNQELENQNRKKDAQISELQKELTENQEKLKKMQSNLDIKSNQLRCAIEVGEYRDDDFKSKVSMRLEDYKLSYIYGDRGYSR